MPQTTKEQVMEAKVKEFDDIYINNNTWKSADETEAYAPVEGMRHWIYDNISSTYDTAYERGVRDAMERIGENYKVEDTWKSTHDRDMPRFSTLDKYEKRVNEERDRLRLALSELLKK